MKHNSNISKIVVELNEDQQRRLHQLAMNEGISSKKAMRRLLMAGYHSYKLDELNKK